MIGKKHIFWLLLSSLAILLIFFLMMDKQRGRALNLSDDQHAKQRKALALLEARRDFQFKNPKNLNKAGIRGKVHDESHTGIAGAIVCAFAFSPDLSFEETHDPHCVKSHKNGLYEFPLLIPTRYLVTASAPRFLPGHYQAKSENERLTLGAGQRLEGIDILLRSGGVEVSGVVKDIGGGGIGGAFVSVKVISGIFLGSGDFQDQPSAMAIVSPSRSHRPRGKIHPQRFVTRKVYGKSVPQRRW
jgi:hypothetical protein